MVSVAVEIVGGEKVLEAGSQLRAAVRFALEAPRDRTLDGDPKFYQPIDRIAPGQVLLEAARTMDAEAEHVMANLMQKDRKPQRAGRIRRLDRALLATVAKNPEHGNS